MASTVKAYKGMGMEGSTARWYDRTTRKDMPEIKALALRIAAAVRGGPGPRGGARPGFSFNRTSQAWITGARSGHQQDLCRDRPT